MQSCSPTSSPQFLSDSPSPVIESRESLPLPHTIGILPFDSHIDGSHWEWLRQGLSDMLTTDLAVWPGIEVVSRQLLGEVLREQWMQHRGMSESDSAVKLGQLSGARYLLKGSVYTLHSHLTVDVHVLDVENGTVLRTARATATLETIPALVRQLAQHIGKFFGGQEISVTERELNSKGTEIPREGKRKEVIREVPVISQADKYLATSQGRLLAADVQLHLDRSQRLREEAWVLADEVWRRAFSIELASPHFSGSENVAGEFSRRDVLWIPVSSFFLPDKLQSIHQALRFSLLPAVGGRAREGSLVWQGDGGITHRIFTERFRAPRRLFVRAISETGEIVSVSSAGSWRVDRVLEQHQNEAIHLSVWPGRTIVGDTGFSTTILAHHQTVEHFDAVVVAVPDERRLISVERVELLEEERSQEEISVQNGIMIQQLKKWFLENWIPPVMESLPVQGYLPRNRRVLQLRVSGNQGKIQEVQLTNVVNESLLVTDVKRLFSRLVDHCLDMCREDSSMRESKEKKFTFRVQLDLIKDLQRVGLGSNIN